jgi:hypothetical protein
VALSQAYIHIDGLIFVLRSGRFGFGIRKSGQLLYPPTKSLLSLRDFRNSLLTVKGYFRILGCGGLCFVPGCSEFYLFSTLRKGWCLNSAVSSHKTSSAVLFTMRPAVSAVFVLRRNCTIFWWI